MIIPMNRRAKELEAWPLMDREGNVLVDAGRFPALHHALKRGAERHREARAKWARVLELRAAGRGDEADGLVRRLLGVGEKKEPMTPEKREYLRRYAQEHKDEIRAKRWQKRRMRRVLSVAGRRRR